LLLAEIGFGCTTRADVNDFSGVVGSSAKGSNLMKGGGFLERIEDDLRRPPEGAGLAKEAGLLLAMVKSSWLQPSWSPGLSCNQPDLPGDGTDEMVSVGPVVVGIEVVEVVGVDIGVMRVDRVMVAEVELLGTRSSVDRGRAAAAHAE
jgi:hypothetical protein